MSERVPRLTLVFAVVTALVAGLGSTGQVEDSPIGPDHEDPTEAELAFYDSEFPCPPVAGLQNSARFVTVDDDVEIKCDYRVDEASPVQTFRVAWYKTDYASYADSLCSGRLNGLRTA